MIGVIVSYALSIFIGLGSSISGGNGDLPNQKCSFSTEGCSDFFTNTESIKYVTHSTRPSETWKNQEYSRYIQLMSISYLYFPMIGTFGTIIFGLIFSWVVSVLGLSKDDKKVSIDCISPPFMWLWKKVCPQQVAKLISEESLGRDIKSPASQNIKDRKNSNISHKT